MVSPTKLIVQCATLKQLARYASLSHQQVGKQFAPLWKVLADQLKVLFPEGDDTGIFIVPALDVRSKVLSIEDRRNGVGKPVFKLAPFGKGQVFASLLLMCVCVPGIPDEVLQQVISQAIQLAQNGAASVCWTHLRLAAFSPPGGSRLLCPRFPFPMGFTICALFG